MSVHQRQRAVGREAAERCGTERRRRARRGAGLPRVVVWGLLLSVAAVAGAQDREAARPQQPATPDAGDQGDAPAVLELPELTVTAEDPLLLLAPLGPPPVLTPLPAPALDLPAVPSAARPQQPPRSDAPPPPSPTAVLAVAEQPAPTGSPARGAPQRLPVAGAAGVAAAGAAVASRRTLSSGAWYGGAATGSHLLLASADPRGDRSLAVAVEVPVAAWLPTFAALEPASVALDAAYRGAVTAAGAALTVAADPGGSGTPTATALSAAVDGFFSGRLPVDAATVAGQLRVLAVSGGSNAGTMPLGGAATVTVSVPLALGGIDVHATSALWTAGGAGGSGSGWLVGGGARALYAAGLPGYSVALGAAVGLSAAGVALAPDAAVLLALAAPVQLELAAQPVAGYPDWLGAELRDASSLPALAPQQAWLGTATLVFGTRGGGAAAEPTAGAEALEVRAGAGYLTGQVYRHDGAGIDRPQVELLTLGIRTELRAAPSRQHHSEAPQAGLVADVSLLLGALGAAVVTVPRVAIRAELPLTATGALAGLLDAHWVPPPHLGHEQLRSWPYAAAALGLVAGEPLASMASIALRWHLPAPPISAGTAPARAAISYLESRVGVAQGAAGALTPFLGIEYARTVLRRQQPRTSP